MNVCSEMHHGFGVADGVARAIDTHDDPVIGRGVAHGDAAFGGDFAAVIGRRIRGHRRPRTGVQFPGRPLLFTKPRDHPLNAVAVHHVLGSVRLHIAGRTRRAGIGPLDQPQWSLVGRVIARGVQQRVRPA